MAWWLLHVDFLIDVTIKECGGHIHLVKMEVERANKGEEDADGRLASGRSKGLIEIDSLLLTKPLDHQAGFVASEGSVNF